MQCPKCHAAMHTYNRNGVQIEQCSGCRGIFLDYGELESLSRLESQWVQQAPPPPAPPARRPTRPRPRPRGVPRSTTAVITAATMAVTTVRASAGCFSPPDGGEAVTTKPPVVDPTGGF